MKQNRWVSILALCVTLVMILAGCGEAAAPSSETPAPEGAAAPAGDGGADNAPAPSASGYPEKVVKVYVPVNAGGGADIFARTMASIISSNKLAPVEFVVENKPGGSSSVCFTFMAEQTGDPYTLGIVNSSYYTTPLIGQSPVNYEDFDHIALMCREGRVLIVPGDSPFNTLEDLVEAARAAPGTLNFGGSSGYSEDKIAWYAVCDTMDITMDYVPFSGGSAELLPAIMGGHLDVACVGPSTVISQIEEGQLKPLAFTSGNRIDILPDTPTFLECGIDVVLDMNRGVNAPKDIPADAKAYLEDLFYQITQTPEWQEYIETNSLEASYLNAADYDAYSAQVNATYAQFIEGILAYEEEFGGEAS